jgi:hypothetical protein
MDKAMVLAARIVILIAALFLATGMANAQPVNYFGNPIGSGGGVSASAHPRLFKKIQDLQRAAAAYNARTCFPFAKCLQSAAQKPRRQR